MAVNFLFTFAMGQAFLSMLCGMQWGIFLLFACFCVLMTAFVWVFLPGANAGPLLSDLFQYVYPQVHELCRDRDAFDWTASWCVFCL